MRDQVYMIFIHLCSLRNAHQNNVFEFIPSIFIIKFWY